MRTLNGLPAKTFGGLCAVTTAAGFSGDGDTGGSGAFFWQDDWTLSDVQTDGDLRVDILDLLTDATDVEYKVDNGSWTSGGSTSSFTISGLTNDQSYLVYIRAAYSGGTKSAHMLPKKGIPTNTPSSTIYASASASGGGAGTSGDPYTLTEAISNMSGGDTVILKDGTYGYIHINTGTTYSGGVVIAAETPLGARINGSIYVSNADNVTFKNLYVAPDSTSDLQYSSVCEVESGCAGIVFEGCKIQGRHDVSTFLSWTDANWQSYVTKLFYLALADGVVIRNCILNVGGEVNYPMVQACDNMVLEYSIARHSGADTLKLKDGNTLRGCWFSDMFAIDGAQHTDIIQRDSPGGTNITIDGNILVEWTYGAGVTPPTSGYGDAQGIGMFDGSNSGHTITNNVIYCLSQHGITINNPTNCVVSNNTIVDSANDAETPTIRFAGTVSNCSAYNNLVSNSITGATSSGSNTTIAYAGNSAYPGLSESDFRLASGNANLTNGDAANDTATDIRGVARDASNPARGAFEDAYA